LLSGYLKRRMPSIQLDGFDPSEDSIGRVDPSLRACGRFVSDLDQLHRLYDLIVIANVMHHIQPQQREATIEQMASRLKPSGKLAIFEHNPANPVTRWIVSHCPFDDDAILLPSAESASYLRKAQLRLVQQDYIMFLPRALALFRPLEPAFRWLPLGAQYVLIGEKR
jgi:trans-aconitate methyltransferase